MAIKPEKTPEIAPGIRIRFLTPYGHMHMTVVVNLKEDREMEIFAQIGKSAEFISAELEGLCRLASLYLRVGGALADIARQLMGIGSILSFKDQRDKSISLPDSLGRALFAYGVFKKKHGIKIMITEPIAPDGEIDIMQFDPDKPETVFTAIVKEVVEEKLPEADPPKVEPQ